MTISLLAASAWSIYVFDRLLDARRPGAASEPGLRHRFYIHNQPIFWVLLGCVSAVLAPVAFFLLPVRVLSGGLLLSALVSVYLVAIHAPRSRAGRWFPKEYAVGALFAAGVTLPFWSRMVEAVPVELLAFALFAFACQINTVAVEFWGAPG